MVHLAKKNICTGCMACVDICSHHAITSYLDKSGHLYPLINFEKCIKCGLCSNVCPILNPLQEINSFAVFNAAWSLDVDLRKKSATAGIFASLAKFVINNGGYVVGAAMDGFEVRHIFINDISRLSLLQGSKYQQGDLTGVYKKCKKLLDIGTLVLFSGVPCQVSALKKFLKKNYPNLYTVDLICGGFPSLLPMNKFRSKYPNVKEIISFRNKDDGWKSLNYAYELKVKNELDQIVNFGSLNLPILAFGLSMTHRKSCLDCRFAKVNRPSDITIGDLWGDKHYINQHKNGVSIVITHSDKGKSLVNSADIKISPVDKNEVVKFNFALINGVKYVKYHFARMFMPLIYTKSYDSILNLYLGKGLLGILFRINSLAVRYMQKTRKRILFYRFIKGK